MTDSGKENLDFPSVTNTQRYPVSYWWSILFCQQFAVASFHFGGVGEAEDKGLVFAVIQDALPLFT